MIENRERLFFFLEICHILITHKRLNSCYTLSYNRTRYSNRGVEMTDKKKMALSILGVLILVVAIIGVSYAAFSYSRAGEKINTITTGAISMRYTESSNAISVTNALPTTDATGKVSLKEGEYFDFTISTTVTGNANINWEIAAQKDNSSTFDGSNIKLYLTKIVSNTEIEVMSPRTYSEEANTNTYTDRPSGMMV